MRFINACDKLLVYRWCAFPKEGLTISRYQHQVASAIGTVENGKVRGCCVRISRFVLWPHRTPGAPLHSCRKFISSATISTPACVRCEFTLLVQPTTGWSFVHSAGKENECFSNIIIYILAALLAILMR